MFLFSSSGTLTMGEKAVLKGKNVTGWLALTTLLGAIFVSIQAVEWTRLYHENVWFHTGWGLHVELLHADGFPRPARDHRRDLLGITTLMAATGRFTPHRHNFLTCVSLYWHFVDLVWIGLFTVMYILPYFIC